MKQQLLARNAQQVPLGRLLGGLYFIPKQFRVP